MKLNQILDHSGPKKAKVHRNPGDTARIIKVYAFLLILFALCFIGKAGYSIYENSKVTSSLDASNLNQGPSIVLNANDDILSIEATYSLPIESVSYQWYRGNVTVDEIDKYESERNDSSTSSDEADDEVVTDDGIKALGKLEQKKGKGETSMRLDNIGIPKGDTTILVTVTAQNNVISKYIQSYHTDIGVDKIAPELNVKLQGTTLIVTATDETEISKLIYSINGGQEQEVTERVDKYTIKTNIQINASEENEIVISAVDKAKNTGSYNKTFEVYVGKPTIEFTAEPDYSKIYVRLAYDSGIKKIEYDFNGEQKTLEFDNPKEQKEYELTLDCKEGYNLISVKVYAEEEQIYAEDSGECEYNP